MAAAIVDISINEHETFEMDLTYWENSDKTEPVDIGTWVFRGAFNFGSKCIPMTFTIITPNTVTARVEAAVLIDLPKFGSYTIEAIEGLNTYRLQQGRVTVDKEIVCS